MPRAEGGAETISMGRCLASPCSLAISSSHTTFSHPALIFFFLGFPLFLLQPAFLQESVSVSLDLLIPWR